ncbi:cupredoxin domain-containing protein [Patescibacteria group bacterium]|nr:cupredoxin domain-containing protein [Patescibacteria group bacterium]
MTVTFQRTAAAAILVSLIGAGCFSSSSAPQATQDESMPVETASEEAADIATTTQTAPADTAATTTEKAPTPTPTPKPKAPPVVKPTTKTVVVTVTNDKFSPQVIAVNAGDTIMWVNKDTLPHTAKSDGALIWDSGTIRPGGTFKRVFAQPGSYAYSCGIHPHMKGTVIVK